MRLDHGAQWELLQVPELRFDERMQLSRALASFALARRPAVRGSGPTLPLTSHA
jgi:hypothetical protein